MNKKIRSLSPILVFQKVIFSSKKEKITPLVILLFSLFCLSITSAKAQDTIDTSNNNSIVANDTSEAAKTEDGYDTSGYYFNWKEHNTDAYTDQKIQVRVSSDSTVQRLRKEDDFWYVNSIETFKKNANRVLYDKAYRDSLKKEGLLLPDEQVFTQEPDGNAWYNQRWFFYLIWSVIILIFGAAVIYFLLSNKINIFSKKVARAGEENEVAEDDLYSLNYDQLLLKYTEEKKYRLAVRVLYLQLLKTLSERQIITFQPQLTNTHYLQQIESTNLYTDFFTVTRHYEYVWYGGFNISEASFQKIKTDFANIKNRVFS